MSSEETVIAVKSAAPPRPALPCAAQDDARGAMAICVENAGKCYQVFARPRDRLWQAFLRGSGRRFSREFWALRDVNFEVRPGETVGIIGRNGSGKSTLLQMICGTLGLSQGRVETRGRVAALLELGAGFHPEFTGRENVFLNARIMGLSRRQTEDRFERIAAFADIGAFIEQPVKTYSSGMYVRLAFAVVANVDADILVIDEALAVGDAFFRQKCMRFLRAFRERGTVLFVSHDASAVVSLCDRALWLEGGQVRQIGAAKAVSEAYFGAVAAAGNRLRREAGEDGEAAATAGELEPEVMPVTPLRAGAESMGEGGAEILGVDVRDLEGREVRQATGKQNVRLRVHFRAVRALAQPIVGFYVNDRLGQKLFGQNTAAVGGAPMAAGEQRVARFTFDMPILRPGSYTITAAVADGTMASHTYHHWIHDAYLLAVEGPDDGAAGLVGIPMTSVEFRVLRKETP